MHLTLAITPSLLFGALLLSACAATEPSGSPALAAQGDARAAPQVVPLGIGDRAPIAAIRTPAGERFDLHRAYRNHPTVLIFYRGGWCPYCNTHLAELAQIEPKLRDLGFQILAVSPDRPEKLQEAIDSPDSGFDYQLLSDQDMTLARAFGVAFRVDDETLKMYEGYGIDLHAASGRSHYELPVPAVYVIDRDRVIRFVHWDEDYRQRLSSEALLETARTLKGM